MAFSTPLNPPVFAWGGHSACSEFLNGRASAFFFSPSTSQANDPPRLLRKTPLVLPCGTPCCFLGFSFACGCWLPLRGSSPKGAECFFFCFSIGPASVRYTNQFPQGYLFFLQPLVPPETGQQPKLPCFFCVPLDQSTDLAVRFVL